MYMKLFVLRRQRKITGWAFVFLWAGADIQSLFFLKLIMQVYVKHDIMG